MPTIDPLSVQRCLAGLTNESVDISTSRPGSTTDEDVANPNIVKAIAPLGDDREVAFARDFVREWARTMTPPFWQHIGVYAYRRAAARTLRAAAAIAARTSAGWNRCAPSTTA